MNTILRPVDPAKRLPEVLSEDPLEPIGPHLVTIVYENGSVCFSKHMLAYYLPGEKCWDTKIPGAIVKEWYEEIPIESLSPSDDLIYQAGKSVCGDVIYKMSIYQEGIIFFKNQQIKNLRK